MNKLNLYKFIFVRYKSQLYNSLVVTDRPLTFSRKRRLYLHPFQLKKGAIFFFRHLLAALLSLKEIVVERFPYLLRFRKFAAKHPLLKHLGRRF